MGIWENYSEKSNEKTINKCIAVFGIFIIFGLIIISCGCIDNISSGTKISSMQSDPVSDTSSTQTADQKTIQPKDLISPIIFSGNGDNVTNSFNLKEGLATFEFTNSGPEEFIVRLLDKTGNQGILQGDNNEEIILVNKIGNYNGKLGYGTYGGEYSLEIKSTGAWTCKIEEKTLMNPEAIKSFEGTGDAVTDFFKLENGPNTISFDYSGDDNFIVRVYDTSGFPAASIANKKGPCSGEKTINGDGRSYVFVVTASGPWSIEITNN